MDITMHSPMDTTTHSPMDITTHSPINMDSIIDSHMDSTINLGFRFLSGNFDEEFYFQNSVLSERENAMDLIHIPTGFLCLFDDDAGMIDLGNWYETGGPVSTQDSEEYFGTGGDIEVMHVYCDNDSCICKTGRQCSGNSSVAAIAA